MKPFLFELAEKVSKQYPDLEGLTFVFPNRRAVIYFRKYLASLLDRPAFSPRMLSIADFIGEFSAWQVPDKLELVYRLYQSYKEVFKKASSADEAVNESFDQFYFWGDMLLRDFEEVDRYLIDAEKLFRDLSNQKELDAAFDFLTDEQVEFLKSFWGNFGEDLSTNKKKFLSVWRNLGEVYLNFRSQLSADGKAYEGMVHRQVAEGFSAGIHDPASLWKGKRIIFAGFNALTSAEEIILASFVKSGLADVHWDVDNYYLHNNTQEAGVFFRQYQAHPVLGKTFSTEVPSHFSEGKNVRIFGAAQPVGQVKLMAQLLEEKLKEGIDPQDTLIVLPDEKLLLPVLHGVSGSVEKLNVTMGFPLASTPMFNLIEYLVELQAGCREGNFNHRHVLDILGHPYILSVDPVFSNNLRKDIIDNNRITVHQSGLATAPGAFQLVFKVTDSEGWMAYLRDIINTIGSLPSLTPLDKEYAFHFLKLVNRLEEVPGKKSLAEADESPHAFQQALKSFMRLFKQIVRSQKIPFTGEPLKGLQIMGMLETRNLDFKNVFVLSLNEGSLPSGGNKPSYVPFNIRKAYGLPTAEHQDAIYAYLFYRVLQRAENVFLFYNTETDVLGQGETSRYLQQILFEAGWKPQSKILHSKIQPHPVKPIEIRKDADILEKIAKLNDGNIKFKGISPSVLLTYIECQLQFFFKHIAKIKEPRKVEADMDARVFGNILHSVIERFYSQILERKKTNLIEKADFNNHESVVEKLIDRVFISTYNLDPARPVTYEGQRLIVREVIKGFVDKVVKHDLAYAPFSIEGLEREGLFYHVPISHAPGRAILGGKIDRVDRRGQTVRVIDYKTGSVEFKFPSVESLFDRHEDKRNKAAFQTMLYALLYQTNFKEEGLKIIPGLFNRENLFDDEFQFGFTLANEKLDDFAAIQPEVELRLKNLLEELFNPEESFKQTENPDTCKYCPYKGICYR